MKKLLLILILPLVSVIAQNSDSTQTSHKYLVYDTHTKLEAMFRSVVIPGWGQFYNKQSLKGALILGTEVVLIAGALYYNGVYNDDYNQYSIETDPLKTAELYDNAQSSKDKRDILFYSFAGVWLLNVLDAYFFGWDYDDIDFNVSLDYDKKFTQVLLRLQL